MLEHVRMLRKRAVLGLLVLTAGLIALTSVAAFASTAAVKVKDNVYVPRSLTIRRGTRVTWTWGGVLRHNVTVRSGPTRFHSRTMARGAFSYTFSEPGTYDLYCTIHRFMKMTVVVR
jgi:plastocyanin